VIDFSSCTRRWSITTNKIAHLRETFIGASNRAITPLSKG
jgi:hypothetical protein